MLLMSLLLLSLISIIIIIIKVVAIAFHVPEIVKRLHDRVIIVSELVELVIWNERHLSKSLLVRE